MTTMVTLKLGGPRLIEAADWMMGKPTPDEVGADGAEWDAIGASVESGVLTVPAHLLADFIEECKDGIVTMEDIAAGVLDDDFIDAKAASRALATIIQKLKEITK